MANAANEQSAIQNTYTSVGDRKETFGQEASMVTLYFIKQFTGGTLKGLVVNETMRFANESLAAEFVKFGRKGCRKPFLGTSPWKIVDVSYQKYWRY